MFSPLEQFEIVIYKTLTIGNWFDISFNNASLFLLFAVISFSFIFKLGTRKSLLIPTALQLFCEQSFSFITTVIKQQAGPRGLRYFPLFFVIFFIILFF